MNAIVLHRPFHAGLHYHILSYLDLGRDAANLYTPRSTPAPFWVAPLLSTYLDAPQRLLTQILPLRVDDLNTLTKLLERSIPALQDAPGRELRYWLLKAINTEHAAYAAAWTLEDRRHVEHLLPQLQTLREHLWAPNPPPTLHLWDCPALLRTDYTHARATLRQDAYFIALAMDAPDDELLIQILHEDTHRNIASFELHHAIEVAAVEAGQRLFEAHAPELLPAYSKWKKRYAMA